jgi:predicted TIM-barrel fold metal-dependent hydrolase
LEYLDSRGIEKAWILTWDELNPVVPLYYTPLRLSIVRQAFKNHPDRIVPFYAPDPARKNWKESLSDCLNEGFAGCGELKVSYRWNDEKMVPLLEFLNEKKLPLVFHMEAARKFFVPRKKNGTDWLFKKIINEKFNGQAGYILEKLANKTGILKKILNNRMVQFPGYLLDFTELEETVRQYSEIKFIAHGPHLWNNFSIPRRDYLLHQTGKVTGKGLVWNLLEQHDNFHCDLSGFSGFNALKRDRDFSGNFLNSFHRKLLFGTDNVEPGLMDLLKKANLSNEKLSDILYNNAIRILQS